MNHYPGETFKTLIDMINIVVSKLSTTFVALYYRDNTLLWIAVFPGQLNSTFKTGEVPDKILIFNDLYMINSISGFCFNSSHLIKDAI